MKIIISRQKNTDVFSQLDSPIPLPQLASSLALVRPFSFLLDTSFNLDAPKAMHKLINSIGN